MNSLSRIVVSVFFLVLATWGHTASGASIVISSSGGGVFTLQGYSLTNAAGIDVTISYETSTLSNPRVVRGDLLSGAMMAANPNTPGIIRIAAVKNGALGETGVIATISFSTAEGSNGKILSLGANVIDSSGSRIGVATQVINPADPSNSQDGSDTSQNSSSTTGDSGQKYLGSAGATLPPEPGLPASSESASDGNSDQPAPATGESGTAESGEGDSRKEDAAATPSTTGKDFIYKGVLDYFREYSGKRSLKAFMDLFNKASMPGIRQEPPVALSDGKKIVKVIINLPFVGKKPPNFSVKKAKFISLKPLDKSWLVEVLPDKNAFESSINVLNNGVTTEIPLTVAPPLKVDIGKIGSDWANETKSSAKIRGKNWKSRLKRKSVAKMDYKKDYALTANYIVKMNSGASRLKREKK
jgi:hypothetical protein